MSKTPPPSPALLERFYRSLYRIRRVEEEIARIYPTDKIQSPIHLSIGQEAVSVGVCQALRPTDVVFGFYRSHALFLAKGGDLNRMIAELYGKASGVAKGKAGSMHLIDTQHGVMGASAVVATTIPHAVGYAYAMKLLGKDVVVACFFGDGAVEEGVFHESINFAVLKKVPVIFVCENNRYAILSRQEARQPLDNICERVGAYGCLAKRIEDNNVFEIYESVSQTVKEISSGKNGPYFFECLTYRWRDHVGPQEDFSLGYRPRAEAEPWMANDPVKRLGERLDEQTRSRIEEEQEAEIQAAFEFAEVSPFPDHEELYTDVFKES